MDLKRKLNDTCEEMRIREEVFKYPERKTALLLHSMSRSKFL